MDDDGRRAGSEEPASGEETESGWAARSELLGEMRALRRQARAARHAYWLPLVLFGLLTCASVPFYREPAAPGSSGAVIGSAGPSMLFLGGTGHGDLAYYWIAALLGGLLLTQLWYRWHARRVGLATPARAYLITTAVFLVAALAIPPLSALPSRHRDLRWLHGLRELRVLAPGDLLIRGTFPFLIIGIGLLVLAWAERSWILTLTVVVYAGAALLASLYDVENLVYRLGWNIPAADASLPNVLLPALVLLLAGAGALAARRGQQLKLIRGAVTGPSR